MCGAQEGDTPLLWAAIKGHATVAELLLNHGACVDLADKVRICGTQALPIVCASVLCTWEAGNALLKKHIVRGSSFL